MSFQTRDIRNIVLLGHSGSGKTTMAEAMLFEAGAITRRGKVEDQNTISDYTQIEQERGNSIFSSLMHATWKKSKLNIIDTPGFDDFIGEVIASLKVADTAVMMINSTHGVEVGTELIWEYIERYKTPAMFVVNFLDHDKADFEQTLSQMQARFGSKVLAIQYPVDQGKGFHTIIDTLRMVMYEFPNGGGKPLKKEIPAAEQAKAQAIHQALVEAAAENEEGLMEKFFENGNLSEEELSQGLTIALANQEIYPVFCASALGDMGSGRVMGFLNDIAPSPADRADSPLEGGGKMPCDAKGKTSIFIYKTMTEPNVGNVSYFKVYSGKIKKGDHLINADNGTDEIINQLYVSNGKNREAVDELQAGDLGVSVKLKGSHTNNTLSEKGVSSKIEKMVFPERRVRVAIKPPSKGDLEKLSKALHILAEEDPTLILEQSAELKQTLLHGQGQLHLDLVKYRVERLYDLKMDFERPRIPYRETITKMANSVYRHKKQSGGAGQFAEVHMRVESYHEGMPNPADLSVKNTDVENLPTGGKLVFMWCIVGGSIDNRFATAIKKGVMAKMAEGPLTGSACRDIRVSVYDGKMHPVDSNDMAFQIASSYAFRDGFRLAGPQILEPIYDLEVLCPEAVMGDVMGDLQTRRAIIMGMDREGHYQKILARVPVAEMWQYASTLRSISQGKAKFHREFADYQSAPPDIQAKLIADYAVHNKDEDH